VISMRRQPRISCILVVHSLFNNSWF
jgi:hypothetical protein